MRRQSGRAERKINRRRRRMCRCLLIIVDDIIKDIQVAVPPKVHKKLLFGEVLSTQLKTLQKNSKERDVFQRCVSGTGIRKYKLLHMAASMPNEKNYKTILTKKFTT